MRLLKTTRLLLCLVTLLSSTLILAQDPAQYGTPFASVPNPMDVNMYQVHIRPYSASGNLAGVTARLDAIKALGINVVYLMPIYPYGTDSRSSNSPYCIKDYKSVGTEYGSLTDLRNLVDGAHSRGMAVILDIAINGTSWDHPWITQHPDWYNQSGGVIQQLATFPDIAGLNFSNTSMRAALVDAMRYWIFAANIDGYRCDFANNPPLDFWTNTISNLRGITSHKLLMLAEGDRLENFQTGFDFNFGDKWYYDAIKSIAGGTSVAQIQTTTNTEYTYATGTQQEVRYTANHDTESSATPFSVFQNHNGVVANFLVSAYMRGVPFLTSGQEVDFNQTIPWPYTSVKINWSNTAASADFTKVLTFRNTSTAIRRGTMANYSDANVCAFTKISGTEKVVVMTNLRSGSQNYVIPAALAGSYKDAYTGASVTLTSGATQALAGFQYIVLTNANVAPVSVTGVSVSPTSASIKAGLTQQLTATITPSNATNQNVTWSSSNTAVATVSTTGLVTGVAAGSATITVTTQDGNKTATAAITVTASTNFTVNFFKPSAWGSTIRIYWWSAQPAGVLADGTWPGVTMTNSGNGWYSYTFINVTSTNLIFNDGTNQTADLTRNKTGWYLNNTWYDSDPGTPIPVTGVTVSPTSATLNVNATQQLTATVTPSNATNKAVTWSTSNASVATVNSSGLVTGVASGTATITVTTQDGNKTATSAITVPSAGNTTYYQIQNRWQTNTYLYDGGNGQVKYGTNPSGTIYQWSKVDAGGGYTILKNRSTGNIMHVENQNGSVQATTGDVTWWSAQWSVSATGDGWYYIINRWQGGERIHIENLLGYAQYSGAQTGWYSAMWNFVNPQVGRSATEADLTEKPTEGVQVYPNPSRGKQITISIPTLADHEMAAITIHDMQGRPAMETKIHETTKIDHNLPAGLYLIRVRFNNTNVVKKMIVE
ncbi:MAG TPA: Ig-like domain-containing protein [Cyclobacteriaceae bacterium]|nr:Ig-like domain-containing protein [Cyclobacteriaceae bacterium]